MPIIRRGADQLKEAGQGMSIKNRDLTPRSVLYGAVLTTLSGCLIGLYLLSQSGPLLWIIGIGGVLVAITYTAGPFPLAYHGLGEIAVAIFMGPAIIVGRLLRHGARTSDQARLSELCLVSLPIAFMVAAILHANNIRDMEADRAVNKRTLAVIFGIRFARAEFMFLVIGAYIAQALLIAAGILPTASLLTLITLPEALRLIRIFQYQPRRPADAPGAGQNRQIARPVWLADGRRLDALDGTAYDLVINSLTNARFDSRRSSSRLPGCTLAAAPDQAPRQPDP